MNRLKDILIAPNVLSQEAIEALTNHIKNNGDKIQDLSVLDPKKSTSKAETPEFYVDRRIRNTQTLGFGEYTDAIHELMRDVVKHKIAPFYGPARDGEVPQLLIYGEGGKYEPHFDGVGMWLGPDNNIYFRKILDRDLTVLIYLNDDFEGGDLIFNDLKIRIRPEPGLLVAFPSTEYYMHQVEPVTKGKRHTIVSWLTLQKCMSEVEEKKIFNEKFKTDNVGLQFPNIDEVRDVLNSGKAKIFNSITFPEEK